MTATLPRSFYEQPTVDVARALLGTIVCRTLPSGQRLSGIVVETEAYLTGDPASHAYRGKTPRNAVMFGPAGHAYIYISYGIHAMLNFVTAGKGIAEAVLIRALEPVDGLETMRALRKGIEGRYSLTSGPGKIGQALALTVKADNGLNLTDPHSALHVLPRPGTTSVPIEIVTTPRIGISAGIDEPWRFYVKGNRHVSRR
jgi:DNA-3-methyladenine glycosylase